MKKISGICPIAPAVFHDDGALDVAGFVKCCDGLIALGAQAMTLFGIAGEYYKLDADEEHSLMKAAVSVCHDNRVPVIVSNTKHSTVSAIRRAREIEDSGADCMMVLPPFFLKPAGAELFDHLDRVCDSVKIPLMIQYAPDQTGVAIPVETLTKLAERHRNLLYFKIECKPPGAYIDALSGRLPPDRKILVGNAGFQMIEGFSRGAVGVMPGPSMPDVYRKIWDRLRSGDSSGAQQLHDKLNALLNHIRQNVEMIIHYEKIILKRRGLISSACCRAPGFRADAVYDEMFEKFYDMIATEFQTR